MKKTTRRQFMANTAKAGLAAGFITLDEKPVKAMAANNLFIHHVYFWLKNKDNKEDFNKLKKGLEVMSKIPYIKMFHIGKPADTNRDVIDTTYSISWMLMFNTKEEQDRYQKDPVHLKFVEECKDLWTRVVVYDTVDI